MSYPDETTLTAQLKSGNVPDDVATTLAKKFAGEKISCNHRIAQKACFDASQDVEVAATAAEILCSYIDKNQCGLKI